MDLKCLYENCLERPMYSCKQDQNLYFCHFHIVDHLQQTGLHEKLSLSDLNKNSSSFQIINKIGDISGLVSGVMMAGKDMFQEICSKLCHITETLAQRQRDLLDIASNASEDANDKIDRLGKIRIKLRSREDFAKLVDQHFAEHDEKVDFSLFSQDIKSIMDSLKESNEFLGKINEESSKDREAREIFIKRLESVEKSKIIFTKEVESKLKIFENEVEAKVKTCAKISETENLVSKINQLALQMQTSNNLVNEINDRCEIIEREAKMRSLINKNFEEAKFELRMEMSETIENHVAQVQSSYNDQLICLNRNWTERETNFRTILDRDRKSNQDKIKNEKIQLTKNNNEAFGKINKTIEIMKKKLNDIEKNLLKSIDQRIKFSIDELNNQKKSIKNYHSNEIGNNRADKPQVAQQTEPQKLPKNTQQAPPQREYNFDIDTFNKSSEDIKRRI